MHVTLLSPEIFMVDTTAFFAMQRLEPEPMVTISWVTGSIFGQSSFLDLTTISLAAGCRLRSARLQQLSANGGHGAFYLRLSLQTNSRGGLASISTATSVRGF